MSIDNVVDTGIPSIDKEIGKLISNRRSEGHTPWRDKTHLEELNKEKLRIE